MASESGASDYNKKVRELRRKVRCHTDSTGKRRFLHSVYNLESDSKGGHSEKPRRVEKGRLNYESDDVICNEVIEEDHRHEESLAVSLPLSDESLYYNLLDSNLKSIQVLSDRIIAVKDFNQGTRRLKEFHYAVVKMNGSLFCSCHPSQEMLLANKDYWYEAPPCVHTRYLTTRNLHSSIEEWFVSDDHCYNEQYEGEPLVYCLSSQALLMKNRNAFCSVVISNGQLKCSCCKTSSTCTAISSLKNLLKEENLTEEMQLFKSILLMPPQEKVVYDRVAVSTCPREYTLRSYPLNKVLCVTSCSSCDQLASDLTSSEVICFDMSSTYYVNVNTFRCNLCGTVTQADGKREGYLNMGDYVVSHMLLVHILNSFLSDGLSLFGSYRALCSMLIQLDQQQPSYYQLRKAWDSFVDLLPKECYFHCPKCGSDPSIIICDGLTLAFRKRYRHGFIFSTDDGDKLAGCSIVDTLLVRSKQSRKEMLALISDAKFNEDSADQLIEIASSQESILVKIFQHIKEMRYLSYYWKNFIKDLLKDSPACGVQCDATELKTTVDEFYKTKDGGQLQKLLNLSPMLYRFFQSASWIEIELVKDIVAFIIDQLLTIQAHPPHVLPQVKDHMDICSFFPALPQLCMRGAYVIDQKKETMSCNKLTKNQKNLLPGVFLMYCNHGICYGFELMDNCESPDIPFTVIRTRFKTAPEVIIYDNGCNLQKYAYGRDPGFFSRTRFLVDRFHWINHTACSSGYNTSSYPIYDPLNTQVAEQRNSVLNKLKASLSYMSQENFFNHLALYLAFRNILNILTLRPPLNHDEETIYKMTHLYKK